LSSKTTKSSYTFTTKNAKNDSIVKACFSEELVKDLFCGEMTHLSFDCPKTLRDTFKTECKRNGLSVCHLLRNFMTSFIIASRLKACFPNTMSVPYVNVENLVTPVFVKGMVRRVKEVESFEVEVDRGRCWYCGKSSVGMFRYVPTLKDYPLCAFHSRELLNSGKWSVAKDE